MSDASERQSLTDICFVTIKLWLSILTIFIHSSGSKPIGDVRQFDSRDDVETIWTEVNHASNSVYGASTNCGLFQYRMHIADL